MCSRFEDTAELVHSYHWERDRRSPKVPGRCFLVPFIFCI